MLTVAVGAGRCNMGTFNIKRVEQSTEKKLFLHKTSHRDVCIDGLKDTYRGAFGVSMDRQTNR